MLRILAPLLGLLASLACSVEPDDNRMPASCTPGLVYACTCVDGSPGTAMCSLDGLPGVCACTSSTDGTTTTDTTAGPSSTIDPTEPCTTDCGDTTMQVGSSDTGACGPIYSGKVDSVSVPWSFSGQTGIAAGTAMCASIGADHVCDYVEVVDAAAAGELDGLVNITSWIHRTTIEPVDGVPSAPGPGGRCVDWTDATGTLADGEWAQLGADGIVFMLDDDTFYDGLDSSHTDPLALPCMTVSRALLCCAAPC